MDLTNVLNAELHVDIKRPADVVFKGVLHEFSDGMNYPDGKSMDMKLEAWPGGRWYRDLGDGNGHLWGHVQTIKAPVLLELYGQMFMSFAAVNHLQLRLTEIEGGTRVTMRHTGVGLIPDEVIQGVTQGWGGMMDALKQNLEADTV